MTTAFRVVALPREAVADLLALSDRDLTAANGARMTADANPGYPCRVSLRDADPGEEVILIHYPHHQALSPYRASGPIYVRSNAQDADLAVNQIPEFLRHRKQSLRGYDRKGMMRGAWVVDGAQLESGIREAFDDAAIQYLHLHNAGPGCFMCEVRRAEGEAEG